MHILQRPNYLIYFDDVRIDPYIIEWSCSGSLFADTAQASITMYLAPALKKWKGYLTQVRIFGENPFTRKFTMLFEGELANRSWSTSKSNSGTITFAIKGFYHWLDIPVPLGITGDEEINAIQRFIYEAQGINIEEVREFMVSRKDMLMLDNNIEELIKTMFEKLTVGYYEVTDENTAFAFAKILERFKIMVDVIEEFRASGFLDVFTFTKASNIQSFYVYLNDVISQLMFEFFQDRDGSLVVKTPSWGDKVLKAHILDASIIERISGMDNWVEEPTRVLAIGADSQLINGGGAISSSMYGSINSQLTLPVGLYVGDPRHPETERYYSQMVNHYLDSYGTEGTQSTNESGEAFITDEWFDNLDGYRVTSQHKSLNSSRPTHNGVDYGFKEGENVYSIGTWGKVYEKGSELGRDYTQRGNYIIIEQQISGKKYYFQYMHFMDPAYFNVGDEVSPGALIGKAGNTGNSSGAHLHFEVWMDGPPYKGTNLEPEDFLKKIRKQKTNVNAVNGYTKSQ